jgi:uncharacterized protein with HEPN domain
MLPASERVAIREMLDAARKILEFMSDRRRRDLDEDEQLSLAVQRLFEILGEAAKKVGPTTRSQASDIKWKEIAGMRDRLAHAYSEVDLNIVWVSVTVELPPLVAALEYLLAASDPTS